MIFPIYINRNPGNMGGSQYLKVWHSGGRTIKLGQTKFIDMGPLNRDLDLMLQFRRLERALTGWLVGYSKHDPTGGLH